MVFKKIISILSKNKQNHFKKNKSINYLKSNKNIQDAELKILNSAININRGILKLINNLITFLNSNSSSNNFEKFEIEEIDKLNRSLLDLEKVKNILISKDYISVELKKYIQDLFINFDFKLDFINNKELILKKIIDKKSQIELITIKLETYLHRELNKNK